MRVVIADDAPLIREGVAHLLMESGVEVVDQVGEAESLLASVRDLRPRRGSGRHPAASDSHGRRATRCTRRFARGIRNSSRRAIAAPRARLHTAARRRQIELSGPGGEPGWATAPAATVSRLRGCR
jgi:hypothetical protein